MTAAVAPRPDQADLAPPAASRGGTMDIATTRAAQEVQAAMVIAKRFPRDVNQAYTNIVESCKRRMLADNALYAYPRGGQTVTGPSIRLAEMLAQMWGNLDFGIIELDQLDGESQVMAYCWDLETNTRQTKVFTVKHERHKKNGAVTKLTDPRDIYEMAANQGARRLRACILGVIPGDIVDSAVAQCERTMQGASSEPIGDRVRKMVAAFADLGVKQDMIERRLGHKLDATTETELVGLKKVYKSLHDGMSQVTDWFDHGNGSAKPSDDLDDALDDAAGSTDGDVQDDESRQVDTQPDRFEQLIERQRQRTDGIPNKIRGVLKKAADAIGADVSSLSDEQFDQLAQQVEKGAYDAKLK